MDKHSKSFLEILILSTISSNDSYGYQIIKSIQNYSEGYFELGEGTIYPSLKRLTSKGYITSYFEKINGRKRKYYTLTNQGKSYLEKHLETRGQENKIIDLLLSKKRGIVW